MRLVQSATDEIETLAQYLAALHAATHGNLGAEFANREMRTLNHAHLFAVPLDPDNGLDLGAFLVDLADFAPFQLVFDSD